MPRIFWPLRLKLTLKLKNNLLEFARCCLLPPPGNGRAPPRSLSEEKKDSGSHSKAISAKRRTKDGQILLEKPSFCTRRAGRFTPVPCRGTSAHFERGDAECSPAGARKAIQMRSVRRLTSGSVPNPPEKQYRIALSLSCYGPGTKHRSEIR